MSLNVTTAPLSHVSHSPSARSRAPVVSTDAVSLHHLIRAQRGKPPPSTARRQVHRLVFRPQPHDHRTPIQHRAHGYSQLQKPRRRPRRDRAADRHQPAIPAREILAGNRRPIRATVGRVEQLDADRVRRRPAVWCRELHTRTPPHFVQVPLSRVHQRRCQGEAVPQARVRRVGEELPGHRVLRRRAPAGEHVGVVGVPEDRHRVKVVVTRSVLEHPPAAAVVGPHLEIAAHFGRQRHHQVRPHRARSARNPAPQPGPLEAVIRRVVIDHFVRHPAEQPPKVRDRPVTVVGRAQSRHARFVCPGAPGVPVDRARAQRPRIAVHLHQPQDVRVGMEHRGSRLVVDPGVVAILHVLNRVVDVAEHVGIPGRSAPEHVRRVGRARQVVAPDRVTAPVREVDRAPHHRAVHHRAGQQMQQRQVVKRAGKKIHLVQPAAHHDVRAIQVAEAPHARGRRKGRRRRERPVGPLRSRDHALTVQRRPRAHASHEAVPLKLRRTVRPTVEVEQPHPAYPALALPILVALVRARLHHVARAGQRHVIRFHATSLTLLPPGGENHQYGLPPFSQVPSLW